MQILVWLVFTDGEHEYKSQVLLTTTKCNDPPTVARAYLLDMFAEGTVQDKGQPNRFWAKGDTRCVTISNIKTLSDAEFDFLKHYLDATSVS